MIQLTHETAAELLFGGSQIPASVVDAARAVASEYQRRHGDLVEVAADMAQAFGDHPAEAVARMRACLAVAPLRVEMPDSFGPPWLGSDEYAARLADAVLAESAGPDDDTEDAL